MWLSQSASSVLPVFASMPVNASAPPRIAIPATAAATPPRLPSRWPPEKSSRCAGAGQSMHAAAKSARIAVFRPLMPAIAASATAHRTVRGPVPGASHASGRISTIHHARHGAIACSTAVAATSAPPSPESRSDMDAPP